MELPGYLTGIVREGLVSSLDKGARTAKVLFPDFGGMVSGDLCILKNPPFLPAEGVPQETDSIGGGTGEAAYEPHKHPVTIAPWLPAVGDRVLCLYQPLPNGGGYILGGL